MKIIVTIITANLETNSQILFLFWLFRRDQKQESNFQQFDQGKEGRYRLLNTFL